MDIQYAEFSMDNIRRIKGIKLIGAKTSVRTPTHTIILLDTSGSMNENNKLNNVKKSLLYLLKYLQPTDILTIISFNNSSTIKMNAYTIPENLEMFRHMIDTLQAYGGTNLSAGLFNVKEIIESTLTSDKKTGLIILTDGHTNEGITRSSDIMDIVAGLQMIKPSLSITTIGYGEDHNITLLRDIGIQGGGSYNIVNNKDEVGATFGEVLGGLSSCVAQNILLQYPSTWKCMNMFPSTTTGDTTTLQIGDLYSESETTIIFTSSDTTPILVKGVNTQTYQIILQSIHWLPTAEELHASYKVSYIQACVAACLISPMITTNVYHECMQLKRYLDDPSIQYHPLVVMLKTEIQSIMNQELNLSERTQHSAFYTVGRGISARGYRNANDDDILAGGLNMLNLFTPFSNRAQRDLTQCMQSEDDPN